MARGFIKSLVLVLSAEYVLRNLTNELIIGEISIIMVVPITLRQPYSALACCTRPRQESDFSLPNTAAISLDVT